jgi:polynucleotide 5'-kinase involved in rRNA processing
MPFWKKDQAKKELYTNVVEGLRQVYKTKLLPLEEAYRFHEFHSSQLEDSDFSAKPMVLLVGQYSVGKTTFIRYLLNVKNLFSCISNSFFEYLGRFSWNSNWAR